MNSWWMSFDSFSRVGQWVAEQVHDCEAERVIDVLEIITEDIPARRLCREPQLVEQLVEVLTPFYIFEQNVDIPVSQVFGRRADRRHSSLRSWSFWQSSRFFPRTVFNSGFRAERFHSSSTSWRSSWWSSRFSSGSGLRSGFFSSSWRR